MTALVTGVGYIGARLALDLLDEGESVVGLENFFSTSQTQLAPLLDHPRFTLVRGSVSDPAALERALAVASPDVVYHLAGQSSAHPAASSASYFERANLTGPRLLLESLRGRSVRRVVVASSFRILGDELPPLVTDEQPYGRVEDLSHLSKIYLEKLAEMIAWMGGANSVAVRLGITYGLGPVMKADPRFQTVPHRFCALSVSGAPLEVQRERPLGFIHLTDASLALRTAARMSSDRPYSVTNLAPEVLTVGQVAHIVENAARARGLPRPPDPGSPPRLAPSFRVQSHLEAAGFVATRRMQESIGEVFDYFHRSAFQATEAAR